MSQKKLKPIIIEFFGLPGSGKSTFVKKLAVQPDVEVIKAGRGKRNSLKVWIKIFPYTILWLLFIVIETVRSGEWRLVRYRLSMVLDTFYRLHCAHLSHSPVVILDEGFAQRFLSCATGTRSHPLLFKMLLKRCLGDVIVFVEIQPPTFHRYDEDHIRVRYSSSPTTWKYTMILNYKILKKFILDSEIRYVSLPNNMPPDSLLKEIRKKYD